MQTSSSMAFRIRCVWVAACAVAASACGASVAPEELITAREALARAQQSPAGQLAPVQVEEARQAVSDADAAFEGGDDDQLIKDKAYIAQRKAEIAIATGNMEQAKRQLDEVARQSRDFREELLTKTEKQLEAERREKEKSKEAVAKTKAELEKERSARLAIEKKLSAALRSLDEVAQVKEETRGVVITLSGSVLFATGKYQLLPIAKQRLDEVAKALNDQGFKQIVVEGHTDSVGSSSKNQELSLQRAQEVRNYLVSRGVPSDKITAMGIGEDRAIADNSTPEGRANNRRVEIVVTPE